MATRKWPERQRGRRSGWHASSTAGHRHWRAGLLATMLALALLALYAPYPLAARAAPPTAHPTRAAAGSQPCATPMFRTTVPIASSCAQALAPAAATLPANFRDTLVFSGLTQPTAIRFSPDGRVFVAEKSGVILVYDSLTATTPIVFADLSGEVDDYWDRGLSGLALDPKFPATPYIYVFYTYDAPIGGKAPTWNDACPTPPGPTTDGCVVSSRLSRLTASGDVMTGTEQVLINGWCQQSPTHSADDLVFGPDGALYVSAGDGAMFSGVDYGEYGNTYAGDTANPCGDPPAGAGGIEAPPTAEGGALRSQSLRRGTGEPVVLNGAILRVDPATGAALPDNPLYSQSDPNAQRIIAYGLRNPYRFTFRPGTSEIWLGDVGWNDWEEINRIVAPTDPAVQNFGWPCYEGAAQQLGYANASLSLCQSLYAAPGAVTMPYYTYNHAAHVVANDGCSPGGSATTGVAFYSGSAYPATYHNALFFADYARNCIWAMLPGANGLPDPTTITTIDAGAASPVDLEVGPNGDIFYVDNVGGTIRRIEYVAGCQPPTSVATASATSGPLPLNVTFDGSGSADPTGGALTYSWDLNGDGTFGDATSAQASYTYTTKATYNVRLQVTNSCGASSTSDPITITAGSTPPTPTITTPLATTTWKVGDVISFSGGATDAQDGTLPASALTWSLLLYHCSTDGTTCHIHFLQTFTGVASGSFTAPDHEYPSYLELRLTATDSAGLESAASVRLDPQTVTLTFQSSPAGLQVSAGSFSGAAPFTRTVIVGSATSISAPVPQVQGTALYTTSRWSDGGAATHIITAGATPATYTATFSSPAVATDWYFAEGYTGGTFTTLYTLANPGANPAHVTIHYALDHNQPAFAQTYTVPANTRITLNINTELRAHGIALGVGVASWMHADQPIVVERPMYYTYPLNGQTVRTGFDVMGATQVASSFAFGYLDTTANHMTVLTVLNPTSKPLYATLTLYAQSGTVTHAQATVAANSRGSINLNALSQLAVGLASATVTLSADAAGTTPAQGLVERSLYVTHTSSGYQQAADVMGVTAASKNWSFAEGYTGNAGSPRGQYTETLTLADPSSGTPPAHVTVTLLREGGGAPVTTTLTLAPDTLRQINVNTLLPGAGNSAQVTADQPILAERVMTFTTGATDVVGARAPGQEFYFAEGYTAGGFSALLTLENPNGVPVKVTVSFLPEQPGSAPVTRTYTLAVYARSTVQCNPIMPNQGFSIHIVASAPIMAERVLYFASGATDVSGYQPAGS